jgi:AcrR family transcriptional regulator
MAALIDRAKRERNIKAKAERKARILEAARSSFLGLPLDRVSLEMIARRAKVREGLPVLYFGSREELFQEVLTAELKTWYGALEEELEGSREPLDSNQVARLLAASLDQRPVLTRLLSLSPVMLEQGTDAEVAFALCRLQRSGAERVGGVLESRLQSLGPGHGQRLLVRAQLLAAALHPVVKPVGMAAVVAGDPDSVPLAVDFREELTFLLDAVLSSGSSAPSRPSDR